MADFDLSSLGAVSVTGNVTITYNVTPVATADLASTGVVRVSDWSQIQSDGIVPFSSSWDFLSSGAIPVVSVFDVAYTVLPLGLAALPSSGHARRTTELASVGSVPTVAMLSILYTVQQPPAIGTGLYPVQDAYVWSLRPAINYGDLEDLVVGKDSTGYVARSLLQFDLSSLPAGIRIVKAELILTASLSDEQLIDAYPVLEPWQELGVTWLNQPRRAPAPVASTQVGPNQKVSIDITDLVKSWYNGSRDNFGVAILGSETESRKSLFGARENVIESKRPALRITYINPNLPSSDADLSSLGTVQATEPTDILLSYGTVSGEQGGGSGGGAGGDSSGPVEPGLGPDLLVDSRGTVNAILQQSDCWAWHLIDTGWYDIMYTQYGQAWQMPTRAQVCQLLQTWLDQIPPMWVNQATHVYVYHLSSTRKMQLWFFNMENWADVAPGTSICYYTLPASRPGSPYPFDKTFQFAVRVNLLEIDTSGGCALVSQGAVSTGQLPSWGVAALTVSLPSTGAVMDLGVSLLDGVGTVSRPTLAGIGWVSIYSEMPSIGMVPYHGSFSLPSQAVVRVMSTAELVGSGYVALAPNELPSIGWVDAMAWSDLPSSGQPDHTPDELASMGIIPATGVSDLPSHGHTVSPWMRAQGEVHVVADLPSLGTVGSHDPGLPSYGVVSYEGQVGFADLPGSGWPAIRDASDLPSGAFAQSWYADRLSQGVVTGRRLLTVLEIQLWPPQGRSVWTA